jgi:hypothetical protein
VHAFAANTDQGPDGRRGKTVNFHRRSVTERVYLLEWSPLPLSCRLQQPESQSLATDPGSDHLNPSAACSTVRSCAGNEWFTALSYIFSWRRDRLEMKRPVCCFCLTRADRKADRFWNRLWSNLTTLNVQAFCCPFFPHTLLPIPSTDGGGSG